MKTNSNNINNSKSNKTKSIIALTSLIIVLSIVNITLLTGTIFGINLNTATNASALSYSTSEDISFTFAPTLSIGLSTDSLTIDNLVPGTTNDSNTVTVTVSSNTPYGYVLSAGVGSNDTTSPYYNTSSLTHENTTISNVFSSVDTNASLDSLDTDNTWGYSTSTDGGTSWSTYSGLSHTATKPLLDISDPATPSTIDFKIAARSATTQASGTYNNVITFYAVGKPEPPLYMQDTAAIKTKLRNEHDSLTAIDQRDGREYTVAKLKDGKIWMTQNLDLAGGTKLYSETSDVPEGYSEASGNAYITLPTSSETASSEQFYTLYNVPYDQPDRTECTDNHPCYSYYSWLIATAYSIGDYQNRTAQYSICPKGWKMPNFEIDKPETDYNTLLRAYGTDLSTLSTDGVFYNIGSSFVERAGAGTVPNFIASGATAYKFFGGNIAYWSSTWSHTSTAGRRKYYFAYMFSIDQDNRLYNGGHSGSNRNPVRCIVR